MWGRADGPSRRDELIGGHSAHSEVVRAPRQPMGPWPPVGASTSVSLPLTLTVYVAPGSMAAEEQTTEA